MGDRVQGMIPTPMVLCKDSNLGPSRGQDGDSEVMDVMKMIDAFTTYLVNFNRRFESHNTRTQSYRDITPNARDMITFYVHALILPMFRIIGSCIISCIAFYLLHVSFTSFVLYLFLLILLFLFCF